MVYKKIDLNGKIRWVAEPETWEELASEINIGTVFYSYDPNGEPTEDAVAALDILL